MFRQEALRGPAAAASALPASARQDSVPGLMVAAGSSSAEILDFKVITNLERVSESKEILGRHLLTGYIYKVFI